MNPVRYRWVKDWSVLFPALQQFDLDPIESALIIPQVITHENALDVLNDIRDHLEPGYMTSLGETLKKSVLSDFRNPRDAWLASFVDDEGNLTPHFERGFRILKKLREEHPELLPATSDGLPPPTAAQLAREAEARRFTAEYFKNQPPLEPPPDWKPPVKPEGWSMDD